MAETGWDALTRLLRSQDGHDTTSPRVTASTVRGLPAMWYSLNRIAGHIGALPLNLYERLDEENARIAREHPAYWLIKHQPNELMTAGVFRETVQHHAILHGDGRAAIFRNGRGEPAELVIMRPDMWAIVITPAQVREGIHIPSKKWHVRIDNPEIRIADRDCLHIMGLSDDGLAGLGILEASKQPLELALSQQWRAVSTEKNGARVKLILKAPVGALRKPEEAQQFIDAFNEAHAGPENADKVALLKDGIEAQVVSQTNQEAQSIEGRKFTRQDIGLLTGVEQMLGDDSSVSYNSLEMKNQAYLTNCLMRWMVRWEEQCSAKLLTTAERNSEEWYFRFITAALLRGTTEERYRVYQIARQIGVMSANEVRELEDMNARTDQDGDKYDNPAITPGNKPTDKPAPSKQDTPPSKAAARLEKLVRASVRRLASTEQSRIVAAAEKERNFCGWVEEFYSTWTVKVGDVVTEAMAPRQLAETWTTESKDRLLAVAGRVTDAGALTTAISSEVATWHERAEQLASAILTESI